MQVYWILGLAAACVLAADFACRYARYLWRVYRPHIRRLTAEGRQWMSARRGSWRPSQQRRPMVYVAAFLVSQFCSLVLLSILLGALPAILLTMFPGTILIHLIARRLAHA